MWITYTAVIGELFRIRPRLRASALPSTPLQKHVSYRTHSCVPCRDSSRHMSGCDANSKPSIEPSPRRPRTSPHATSYVLRSSPAPLSLVFLSRLPPLLHQQLRFDEHVVEILQLLLPPAVQPAE